MATTIVTNVVGVLVLCLAIHALTIQSVGNGDGRPTELTELRAYLRAFGYLNRDDDDDEENVESAIKAFQRNYRLNVTGKLDSETMELIDTPRCGVPDGDDAYGSTLVNPNPMGHHDIGANFAFFPGKRIWPPTKRHLTYKFNTGAQSPVGPTALATACRQGFDSWAGISHFTFEEVDPSSPADILISFQRGDHGDGRPFDGPGNVLAHAFAPTDGRLHLDAEENWSVEPPSGDQFDLVWAATHEIGHILGLAHSTNANAIMYAFNDKGTSKRALDSDDIAGILALYSNP